MTEKEYFFKHLTVLVDTREQRNFEVLAVLKHYNVNYITETFSTGDYSFKVDGKSYKSEWLAERKGSLNELYGNVSKGNKDANSKFRNNFEEELERKKTAGVKEFVLLIEGAKNLAEIRDFSDSKATVHGQKAGLHIYSTLMSWMSANRYDFKIFCSMTQVELAKEMLSLMYYFWRNDMREKLGNNFLKILQEVRK